MYDNETIIYTFQAIAFTVSIVMGLLILRGMEKDAN